MLGEQRMRRISNAIRGTGAPISMGRVARVEGLLVGASVRGVSIGDGVEIVRDGAPVLGEVVGFGDGLALIMTLSDPRGIAPGARVRRLSGGATLPVSSAMLGRVIDPFGAPLDGGALLPCDAEVPIEAGPPLLPERTPIGQRFDTGVRIIDGLLTCGLGQRVGIFAGAGVGKTVLIRSIMARSRADVVVVGLIGERGCEVADMMAHDLGSHGVVVVATSDRSPLERVRGARAATAVAEHFRDQGKDVLLIIDSLTRYAMALREIGLSAGEPPATKGYPPSVFAALPRLLERVAPLGRGGSITAFYTVLVEGDDLSDPVADSARSLLDGHIVLSRDMAARGHFPAVDVLSSASRVALKVQTPEARDLAQRARAMLAARRDVEELRALGAHVAGANPAQDEALDIGARLDGWSRQGDAEMASYDQALAGLKMALQPPPRAGAAGARR